VNNTWSTVISMSCPRGGVGVAALGGKLYAVGGHDGTNYLSSVEEYDPLTDWYVSHLTGSLYFLPVCQIHSVLLGTVHCRVIDDEAKVL